MRDKLEAVLDNGNGLPGRNPGNGNGKIDNGAAESEMEFRKRYRLCRELMDRREQLKAGDRDYALKPGKVICLMDYEDRHAAAPQNKIVFRYGISELETHEMYGRQLTFHLVELPRVMSLTDNFDSPVAGWCRIFRNIANFAQTQGAHEGRFGKAVRRDGERLPQLTEPEDNNDNRTAEC